VQNRIKSSVDFFCNNAENAEKPEKGDKKSEKSSGELSAFLEQV
jgi:hypothetical protein